MCTVSPAVAQGIQDCLGTLLRNEGPRYLFRGLVASLCGIVPYAGTELTTITALNKLWGKTFPDKQPTPLVYLGTGEGENGGM